MANISRRRTGELTRALFHILKTQPEGMRAADALAALEKQVVLTEYEAGDYETGGRRFEKIVRFSTVAPVKAGWLVKDKGIWTLTPEGEAALHAYPDPEQFIRAVGQLYKKWKSAQPVADEVDDPEGELTEESASITLEEAEEMAWAEIEAYLAAMPPYDFQELVASLLRAMGYHVAWVAPPGKDGGTDIIAYNDPLGTRPPRIKVQVKRNANSPRIDVTGLRSFMAVLGEGDVGLFVALSGFTKDADYEARQSHRRINLIDARRLVGLWTTHYAQLDDSARTRLPLKPVWFLAGDD
ncbi:restriction system protein [Xanthomonas arboricola]|uniref:restriction endonuclease n=1 Tax=Xanthomonas arboricola TaxID=56448 RepID=UPI00141BC839|nr:restriction endonuclease [Xanthomonas arboricola]NIK34911.1 restriction system protein [Xanthomonas arboricola]